MIGSFIGEELIERLVTASQNVFSTSAGDAVRELLGNLKFPVPDMQAMADGFYSTFFGAGLLVGAVVTVMYLFLVAKYATVLSLKEMSTVLIKVYLFGALLPWLAQVAATAVHVLTLGLIEWLTGGPYSEDTFPVNIPSPLSLVNAFFAKLGAGMLNLEFQIFTEFLPMVLAMMALVFAFRWFGAFGDGLFVFLTGVGIMLIAGPLASVTIIAVCWPLVVASSFFGLYLATVLMLAALAPFLLLFIYVRTGLSQKMRGVMESKQLNAKVSRMSGDSSEGSSTAATAAKAGMTGAIAGFYLSRRAKGQDKQSDATGSRRDAASSAMAAGAAVAAKSHPVTAATVYATSRIIKPKPKPKPVGPPQQGMPPHQAAPPQPPPQRPPTAQPPKGA